MGDSTPECKYPLRSQTPRTPKTPGTPSTPSTRILRSASTPATAEKLQQSATPTCVQRILRANCAPKSGEKLVFRSPMLFKPHLVGNKLVPSPSRPEMWKQQLGLADDPTCGSGSDKENSSSDDEDNQKCRTSLVEYRALQKVLADKSAQRDETLLQVKTCKDKIRHYKARLEREENTKRQQLKMLRKTHEVQVHEKDALINNLQAIVEEQEACIKELETQITAPATPKRQRKIKKEPVVTPCITGRLIEEIKQLQAEKVFMSSQLSECQTELGTVRQDSRQEVDVLRERLALYEAGKRKPLDEPSWNHQNNQMMVSGPCSTDTEKEVEVLQAERDRLLQELTDTKNAHTKVVTVSKLNTHRQQQLEEEVKRLKSKNSLMEEEIKNKTLRCEDRDKLQLEVTSQTMENLQSAAKVRDLQAEIFSLHAKSPEVVKVTKVRQVESEKLKRQYDDCRTEVATLTQALEDRKDELHNAKSQAKYLERMLEVTQEEKKESDASLWREMESLVAEHKLDKEQALQQMETKLTKEKETALHDLQDTLHQQHADEERKLKEDMTIAKMAAVTKTREELSRDKQHCIHTVQQQLKALHDTETSQLREQCNKDVEAAADSAKQETRERMLALETKYDILVTKLALLNPVVSELVESYILLQRDVQNFPKVVTRTVTKVKKEMVSAISGISNHNKVLSEKYYNEMKLRKKYHNELVELRGNIRVLCRVRPVIKEDGQGQQADHIVQLDSDDDGVLTVNSKGRTQTFEVDRVFGETSTQAQVFEEVKALVVSCVDGYNVCIFAYGQTGSGKTYTMEGTPSDQGINQRALGELFSEIASRGIDWEFTVTVSVIEIYNEAIRDLLGDDTASRMEVKMNPEGGLHIPGLCYVNATSVHDVNECFNIGHQNRATAATNMNEHSSRSHCLLAMTVSGLNTATNVKTTGKLNLVDLAGSERVSKSKADGTRLKEAQSINKSLSCLGDVIHALRSKMSYVPYRNSKLTYLLQDSLGGDSKTLMITQVAPVRKNEAETICSLNFAQRVRNVELGAATRRQENGDIESDTASPARQAGTPHRGANLKPGTPSSNSKLTPLSRQARRK